MSRPSSGRTSLLVDSFLDVTVRTGTATPSGKAQSGDYGLTTTSSNISADIPVAGIQVTLWGTPADSGPRRCAPVPELRLAVSVHRAADAAADAADHVPAVADDDRIGGFLAVGGRLLQRELHERGLGREHRRRHRL